MNNTANIHTCICQINNVKNLEWKNKFTCSHLKNSGMINYQCCLRSLKFSCEEDALYE